MNYNPPKGQSKVASASAEGQGLDWERRQDVVKKARSLVVGIVGKEDLKAAKCRSTGDCPSAVLQMFSLR